MHDLGLKDSDVQPMGLVIWEDLTFASNTETSSTSGSAALLGCLRSLKVFLVFFLPVFLARTCNDLGHRIFGSYLSYSSKRKLRQSPKPFLPSSPDPLKTAMERMKKVKKCLGAETKHQT